MRYGVTLPVSLLLKPNEEDHVFRFVVVNQMAAPIGRALLGTIVFSDTWIRGSGVVRGDRKPRVRTPTCVDATASRLRTAVIAASPRRDEVVGWRDRRP